jgi:hypothetical protein
MPGSREFNGISYPTLRTGMHVQREVASPI